MKTTEVSQFFSLLTFTRSREIVHMSLTKNSLILDLQAKFTPPEIQFQTHMDVHHCIKGQNCALFICVKIIFTVPVHSDGMEYGILFLFLFLKILNTSVFIYILYIFSIFHLIL